MSVNILKSLSMKKYERMLPRVFPGVARLEIRDKQGDLFWEWSPATERKDADQLIDFSKSTERSMITMPTAVPTSPPAKRIPQIPSGESDSPWPPVSSTARPSRPGSAARAGAVCGSVMKVNRHATTLQ